MPNHCNSETQQTEKLEHGRQISIDLALKTRYSQISVFNDRLWKYFEIDETEFKSLDLEQLKQNISSANAI